MESRFCTCVPIAIGIVLPIRYRSGVSSIHPENYQYSGAKFEECT